LLIATLGVGMGLVGSKMAIQKLSTH